MAAPKDSGKLADVLALVEKATPEGDWSIGKIDMPRRCGGDTGWDDHGGVRVDALGIEQLAYFWNASHRLLPGNEAGPAFGANDAVERATAAIAAVNHLRTHGRAIAELVEAAKATERHLARFERENGWRDGEQGRLDQLRAALRAMGESR